MLVAVAALGIALDPVTTLSPALVASLGASDELVGVFVAAFGGGAIVAGLANVHTRLNGRFAFPGAVGLGAACAGLAIAGVAPLVPVALFGYAVLGAGYLVAITDVTTRIQERVPERLRGRVMALWSWVLMGVRPAAAAASGALADAQSVGLALLALAAVPGAVAVALRRRRAISSEARPAGRNPVHRST